MDEVCVVTDNRQQGFLSLIPNVRLLSIPIVDLNIPMIGQLLSDIILFFISLKLAFRYKTFYVNTIMPYSAMLAGYIARRKVICHVHEYFVVKRLRTNISCWCVEHIPMIILFVSNYLKEKYIINKRSISHITYNKLPKEYIEKVIVKPLCQRSRNSVLLISSLTKVKGIFNFIELAKEMPQQSFIMVISTTQDRINTFFDGVFIPENCIIHPTTNNIHQYLYDTDLIINMSIPELWTETFGMTILEAMPYGIPAIVPNAGGPLELIENGVNGYAIDVTNIGLVKEKIEYILNCNNYRQFSEGTIDMYNLKFA